jgi:hypothetical protein
VGQTHLSRTTVSLFGRDPGVPMSHNPFQGSRQGAISTTARSSALVCSTGKSVNTLLVTRWDRSGFTTNLSNIMVNVEELSEEDQRKYIEL